MLTKAAILCGGEGKRLLPLTNYFQKTMIPIGAKRKPLLEYVVKLLVYHNIHSMTMLTGYRDEEIVNYFGDGSRFNAKISYSKDSEKMKGSAGSLANAILSGKISKFDNLVVYYGDILSNLNLRSVVDSHVREETDATLVLAKGYTLPVGVAEVKNGSIASLKEKPNLEINVTTGNMVLGKRAIEFLKSRIMLLRRHGGAQADLMKDFVPALLSKKYTVRPYYMRGFWYDVGTIEKYQNLTNKIFEKYLGFLDGY